MGYVHTSSSAINPFDNDYQVSRIEILAGYPMDFSCLNKSTCEIKLMNKRKLKVQKTENYKLIKNILCNEDIAPNLISFKYENMEKMLNNELMTYYLFIVDENIAGFCAFKDLKDMCNVEGNYAVDVGIYKKYRGKIGYDLGQMALKEFNEKFSPNKIFALIKESNRASLYYTKKMGFKLLMKQDEYCILGT